MSNGRPVREKRDIWGARKHPNWNSEKTGNKREKQQQQQEYRDSYEAASRDADYNEALAAAYPPLIFGSSPRTRLSRGHRRSNTAINMSHHENAACENIGDSTGIDIDAEIGDEFTPRPRKRLTAIKENPTDEEAFISEQSQIKNPEGDMKYNLEAKAMPGRVETAAPLRISTGSASLGTQSHSSTGSRSHNRGQSGALIYPSSYGVDLETPTTAPGYSTPSSSYDSSPDHYHVVYGSSGDEPSLVNWNPSGIPPQILLKLRVIKDPVADSSLSRVGTMHANRGLTTTPSVGSSAEMIEAPSELSSIGANDVDDLLHQSPRLQRRAARESLRSVDDVYIDAQENANAEANTNTCSTVKPTARFPNIDTKFLHSLNFTQKEEYLDSAIAQAEANSQALGIPFMIMKDGRSQIFRTSDIEIDFIPNPQAWKQAMLADSMARSGGSIGKALSAENQPSLLQQGLSHFKKKPASKESADLDAREHLEQEEDNRAKDSSSLLDRANPKARKILGQMADPFKSHGYEHSVTGTETEAVKSDDERSTMKSRFFSDKKRASRSMTDVTDSDSKKGRGAAGYPEDVEKHHRGPMPPPKDVGVLTGKQQKKSILNFSSPMRKTKSQEVKKEIRSNSDVSREQADVAIRKGLIGRPTNFTKLSGGPPDVNTDLSDEGSINSSDYSGDETSVHTAQMLRIIPVEQRGAHKAQQPDPYQGMGMVEKMEALKMKKEAEDQASQRAPYGSIGTMERLEVMKKKKEADNQARQPYKGMSMMEKMEALKQKKEAQNQARQQYEGMGMMEKMEAMKRKKEAEDVASVHHAKERISPTTSIAAESTKADTAGSHTSTNSMAVAGGPTSKDDFYDQAASTLSNSANFDPFAGVSNELSPSKSSTKVFKSAFPGPITRSTALTSNVPTDEEREFARQLTQRNRTEKATIALNTPTKTTFSGRTHDDSAMVGSNSDTETGEQRPKTAPEGPVLSPKRYAPRTESQNMTSRGRFERF